MTDVNKTILIGRLTRDLGSDERSFGYMQNGQARANVSIAVNRSKKQGDEWVEEVSYFDVTIWGKTAENLKPYLTKGKQICVEAHLKQDRWEKDGQKFSKVAIIADNVQLLGYNSDNNGQQNQPQSSYAQQYENQQNPFSQPSGKPVFKPVHNEQPQPVQQEFDSGSDFPEDIPF